MKDSGWRGEGAIFALNSKKFLNVLKCNMLKVRDYLAINPKTKCSELHKIYTYI